MITLLKIKSSTSSSILSCCPAFISQILAANILEDLVYLASSEDNSDLATPARTLTLRFSEHELIRPPLGNAGFLQLLVDMLNGEKRGVNKVTALNGLCLFSKEAVNRVKIFNIGGLEVMMRALKREDGKELVKGKFAVLYDRIISSMVNFLYSDEHLTSLLDQGLMDILLNHLQRCCDFEVPVSNLKDETDNLAKSLMNDKDETDILAKSLMNDVEDEDEIESNKYISNASEKNNYIEFQVNENREFDENKDVDEIKNDDVDLQNNGKAISHSQSSACYTVTQNLTSSEKLEVEVDASCPENDPLTIDQNKSADIEDINVTDAEETGTSASGKPTLNKHVFSINSPTASVGHASPHLYCPASLAGPRQRVARSTVCSQQN